MVPGGSAAVAGLKSGDVIFEVCGYEVSQETLDASLKACGEEIDLQVFRPKGLGLDHPSRPHSDFSEPLEPEDMALEASPTSPSSDKLPRSLTRVRKLVTALGWDVEEHTFSLEVSAAPSADMQLDEEGLITVQAVRGAAELAGFQAGDIIFHICGRDVTQTDFGKVFRRCGADMEAVDFKVYRPRGSHGTVRRAANPNVLAALGMPNILYLPSAGGVSCAELPLVPAASCQPGPSGLRSELPRCPDGLQVLLDLNQAPPHRHFGCEYPTTLCCAPPTTPLSARLLRDWLTRRNRGEVLEEAFLEQGLVMAETSANGRITRRQE